MNTEVNEKKVPTKAEVLAFYKEQIEVAKLRRDLAEIVAQTAEFDAKRVEAIAKQAHFTAPQGGGAPQGPDQFPEGVIQHTVTQEDLDANPELAGQGIKVGDIVGITERPQPEEEELVTEGAPVRQLKKD